MDKLEAERSVGKELAEIYRLDSIRHQAETDWLKAVAAVKREARAVDDQLRQASEAAYFQGGRKGFSNDL